MPTNPTPTQPEALEPPERIWINNPAEITEHDQRWWYENPMAFPTIEYRRAAVAEPRRDGVDAERLAATIVALWRAENSDDRTLVKYIKQSLLGARIGAAATSSPAPADGSETWATISQWCDFCGSKIKHVCTAFLKEDGIAPPERTQVAGEQENKCTNT